MVSQEQIRFGHIYAGFNGLAALASGSVVLTGLMFPRQIISPSKPFSHIIFCISFCDFIASVAGTFGLPPAGTPICQAQAFLTLFFYPASWVWTTILVFQIRSLLVFKQLWLKPKVMHAICWFIACCCAFVPLSTNTYGQDDTLDQEMPCNFSGNVYYGFVWGVASFASIILVCALVMVLCMCHVIIHWIQHGKTATDSREYALLQTTRMYPVAMLLCWLPFLSLGVLTSVYDVDVDTDYFILLILSSQFGTFLTLVFFTNCRVAIVHWRRFFGCEKPEADNEFVGGIRLSEVPVSVGPTFSTVDVNRQQSGDASSVGNTNNLRGKDGDFDDESMLYGTTPAMSLDLRETMNSLYSNQPEIVKGIHDL